MSASMRKRIYGAEDKLIQRLDADKQRENTAEAARTIAAIRGFYREVCK